MCGGEIGGGGSAVSKRLGAKGQLQKYTRRLSYNVDLESRTKILPSYTTVSEGCILVGVRSLFKRPLRRTTLFLFFSFFLVFLDKSLPLEASWEKFCEKKRARCPRLLKKRLKSESRWEIRRCALFLFPFLVSYRNEKGGGCSLFWVFSGIPCL